MYVSVQDRYYCTVLCGMVSQSTRLVRLLWQIVTIYRFWFRKWRRFAFSWDLLVLFWHILHLLFWTLLRSYVRARIPSHLVSGWRISLVPGWNVQAQRHHVPTFWCHRTVKIIFFTYRRKCTKSNNSKISAKMANNQTMATLHGCTISRLEKKYH